MLRRKRPSVDSAVTQTLVVWDFDWSLINENSDTYVLEQVDAQVASRMEKKLLDEGSGIGWTQLMDWSVGELHKAGHTPQAIRKALVGIPVLGGALAAFDAAKAAGAQQRILSDANSVYISTILEARGLSDAVPVVVTNPAAFDDEGRLHIKPLVPKELPHACPRCPPNLCKGAVLESWLEELRPRRCIYVGDGGGDFCPATRLRPQDVVLARQSPHDGLLRKCRTEGQVQAEIVEWGGDADAEGAALRAGMEKAVPVSSQ